MRKIILFSVVVFMSLASCTSVQKTATVSNIEVNVIGNKSSNDYGKITNISLKLDKKSE